ncbi:MAG: extracellular solute-binding protein [Lachnospiraceae bacterium]|nr:extracellular solute-binding protein [Lachnospiraceae bacterium]
MKKRRISTGIYLALIVCAFVGCEKTTGITEEQLESTIEYKLEEEQNVRWGFSHTKLTNRYETSTIHDGKIYGCYYCANGMAIAVQNIETGEVLENYELSEAISVQNITVDGTDSVCVFGATGKNYAFWKISLAGDIEVIEDVEVENMGSRPTLKGFYADKEGNYYLWYEMSVPCAEVFEDEEEYAFTSYGETIYIGIDRIYVKDQNMKTICYDQTHDEVGSFVFDENGFPTMLAKDIDGYYTRRVRTEEGPEYEQIRIEDEDLIDINIGNKVALTDEGLLYIYDGALYLYQMAEGIGDKLLDLAGGGIYEEDIIYLGMKGDVIEIIDNYKGSENSEYTRIEPDETQENVITLGLINLDPDMRTVITSFNRYQNEVRIEPIVYMKGYDYTAACQDMWIDMLQGKAPDIIETDGINYELLANKGAFLNLYEFMESDAKLKKESFVPSVLKTYEQNGNLYNIAPNFRLYTVWGASSLVQGRYGVDTSELIQMLEKQGGDINSIYGLGGDESVLTTLCTMGMSEFIDWDTGTCDFTGESFCQLLDFVKEYEGAGNVSYYRAVNEGDVLLTLGLINSVENYVIESEIYGEDIEFIGCPTGKGTGSVLYYGSSELAINSGTEHAKEAWEFVKYYLLNGYNGTGFPTRVELLEQVFEESMKEEFVEENGIVTQCIKGSYQEWSVVDIKIYKAEQSDVDAVRELIERANGKYQYYVDVLNIIEEEAAAYFKDQKTIEQVTDIIQNRVQLFLDEKGS